jgi:hypothetical protein
VLDELHKLRTLQETVIGILLRNPDLFMAEPLEPVWFGKYAVIVEAMFRLVAKGMQIDLLTLESEIPGRGVLGRLSELHAGTLGARENYPWFLGQLREQYQGGQMRTALRQALGEIEAGDSPREVAGRFIASAFVPRR